MYDGYYSGISEQHSTVETLNNGHFGTNINSSCLSPV